MIRKSFWAALAAATLVTTGGALAQQAPVKIGFVTTLTTPSGYLGEDVRDGFTIAMDQEGGNKLGGVAVELMVADDGVKPDVAKQLVERMMQKDGAKIISGIIFSNIVAAVAPDVVKAGGFYVGPNGAPNNMAGADCHPNYFIASWQAGTQSDMAGLLADKIKANNVVLVAPDYVAGKDQIAGFKRYFKGTISGEILTKLGQTDYAAEITRIRSLKPDAVFFFLPGGMGVSFIKQVKESGLQNTALLAPLTVDDRIVESLGDKAMGIRSTTFWNWDYDNAASKKFVADYKKKHGKVPTTYAAQGYDAARLIASALKAVGGDMSKADAFRAALKKADFVSIRGSFKFANNNHPIQTWHARDVVKNADGTYTTKTAELLFADYKDPYAAECKQP